jgi:hypothetical protein
MVQLMYSPMKDNILHYKTRLQNPVSYPNDEGNVPSHEPSWMLWMLVYVFFLCSLDGVGLSPFGM